MRKYNSDDNDDALEQPVKRGWGGCDIDVDVDEDEWEDYCFPNLCF